MATVQQVTASYENHLLPVLSDQAGVCGICGTASGDFPRCWQCNQARHVLVKRASAVVPIALAVKGGQLARDLSGYKNSGRAAARDHMRVGLAAVLWRWLSDHEPCVAAAAGIDAFPLVTHVPSTSGRTTEPVQDIISLVGAIRERHDRLLEPVPDSPPGREARTDRYRVTRRLSGEPVLLIDDTWTTGGHAQSAAFALRSGGAGPVGLVVIGRHFTPQPAEPYRESAEEYLRQSRAQGWDWKRCRLE